MERWFWYMQRCVRCWLRHPRRAMLAVTLLAALAVIFALARDDEAVTAAHFATLTDDPTALRPLLQRMPKGGDLHVHLSGAIYAERYIAWAAEDGWCVDVIVLSIVMPPCKETNHSMAMSKAVADQSLYDRLVNSLSMRSYVPTPSVPSAHDQFFSTFAKLNVDFEKRGPDMIIDQLTRYQAESTQYVEFMMTFLPGADRRTLALKIGDETDPSLMLKKIVDTEFDQKLDDASRKLNDLIRRVDEKLDCDGARLKPGCAVTYRFIAQIARNSSPAEVLAQIAFAVGLIKKNKKIVAFNFVQPEDWRVSRTDYKQQMDMIRALTKNAKDINVTLHAGELWTGLVPPEDLNFHIRDAIEIAGALRIGHGVSLAFEKNRDELLAKMRERIAVEINLTSNDTILGVSGKDHPLLTYLRARVPVVLSTDDAGISRIDLTHEYVRAAREHRLSYRQLKAIAHNAIEHSFLSATERPIELARLNTCFTNFEREVARAHPLVESIKTLAGRWFGQLN